MATESKQKNYDAIRGQVSARIIRALDIGEADIAGLSLAELINTLFLIHGDSGSTGNFSVSFAATVKMVGRVLMWQEPETKVPVIEPPQRVQ